MNRQTIAIALYAALQCAIAEGWTREQFQAAATAIYDGFASDTLTESCV